MEYHLVVFIYSCNTIQKTIFTLFKITLNTLNMYKYFGDINTIQCCLIEYY